VGVQLSAQRRHEAGERELVPGPGPGEVSLIGALRPGRDLRLGSRRESSRRNFVHERRFCLAAAVSLVGTHITYRRSPFMSPSVHPHRPAWFVISTPDASQARRFSRHLFGWPSNVVDAAYALLAYDGGRPTGRIGQAVPDRPNVGLVAYFTVGDVHAALARAAPLAGSRVLAPVDTPVSRIAVFIDLDGTKVGLAVRSPSYALDNDTITGHCPGALPQ
jgi:predicted enzyme related to lactoylglutathione lyase